MTTLLVVVTVLLSVTLIVFIAAFVAHFRQFGRAARETADTLKAVRESILPLADDARQVMADTDGLVRSTRVQVERIDRLLESVERLVQGRTVADAAGKAAAASRVTFVSMLEGLKQGLKVLRSAKNETKEEPENEQQR